MAGVALMHVLPLPPEIWHGLPNRSLVVAIETSANLHSGWRPQTFESNRGWGALLAIVCAVAIALLASQLDKNERWLLVPVLIILSAASGLIGLLQSVGNGSGPLYFYQVTNNDSAVGLLANRNHAATLLACIFPMLAAFASKFGGETADRKGRQIWCGAIALVTVPLILVTGSRAGFLVALIGLVGAGFIYRAGLSDFAKTTSIKQNPLLRRNVVAVLLILGLASLTIFVSRAKAFDRLFALTTGEDGRLSFVKAASNLSLEYLPWGAGSGSFPELYKIVELPSTLAPVYVNHVHNDWVEVAVNFGIPGVCLMAAGVVAFLIKSYQVWRFGNPERRSVTQARMASICMVILAVASLSDYPLRTPLLFCLAVLFSVMLFSVSTRAQGKTSPN